jgi:CubicO group peptidase (beta-lactamase class C family)
VKSRKNRQLRSCLNFRLMSDTDARMQLRRGHISQRRGEPTGPGRFGLLCFLCVAITACSPVPSTYSARATLPAQVFASQPTPSRTRDVFAIGDAASKALQAEIQAAMKVTGIPGASVAIVYDRKVAWTGAFGFADRDTRLPMKTDTLMRIGSVSKVFTGLGLLKLRDEGGVELDQPVASVVPELSGIVYPTSDSPRITFRHLLTHTSGLPRVGQLDYYSDPNTPVTMEALAHSLKGAQLAFSPGTDTMYSNLAVGVAGVAVGRLAGKPLRAYLAEKVFIPLGMDRTTFDLKEATGLGMATGYESTADGLLPRPHWNLGVVEGMGGIYSTLDDMARFAAWQTSAWPPRHAKEEGPVARATLRQSQLSLGGGDPSSVFGANWGVQSSSRFGLRISHTGSTHQYSATIKLFPKAGLGVLVLTNVGGLFKEQGQPAASTLARVVSGWLERNLPSENRSLPSTLKKASQDFTAVFDAPSSESIKQVFHKTFLAHLPTHKLLEMFVAMKNDLGSCRAESGEEQAPQKGHFVMACDNTKLKLMLVVDPSPPHQITGMSITPITP